jgi:hypothetical protein
MINFRAGKINWSAAKKATIALATGELFVVVLMFDDLRAINSIVWFGIIANIVAWLVLYVCFDLLGSRG